MATFELKNYKKIKGSEGNGFTAALYVNGVKSASVSNYGDGGCNRYIWSNMPLKAVFDQSIAECTFKYDFEKEDQFVNNLVDELNRKKDCKKKTIFSVNGSEFEINKPYSSAIREYILNKYPAPAIVEFVNERYL